MINHHHHSFLGTETIPKGVRVERGGKVGDPFERPTHPSFDHQRSLIFSPPAPPVALANRSETRRSLASQFCFRFGVPLPFYSFPFGAFHAILSQRGREARGMSGHSRSGNRSSLYRHHPQHQRSISPSIIIIDLSPSRPVVQEININTSNPRQH